MLSLLLIRQYNLHLLIAAGLELLQYALIEFQFLFILSDLSVKFFTAVIMRWELSHITLEIFGYLQFGIHPKETNRAQLWTSLVHYLLYNINIMYPGNILHKFPSATNK